MQDEITYRLLKSLDEDPRQSQRERSQALGISLGKLNYCLRALIDKGWVKARNFGASKNKPAYLYLLTPAGAEQKARVTMRFLRRKLQEYEELELEIAELKKEVNS